MAKDNGNNSKKQGRVTHGPHCAILLGHTRYRMGHIRYLTGHTHTVPGSPGTWNCPFVCVSCVGIAPSCVCRVLALPLVCVSCVGIAPRVCRQRGGVRVGCRGTRVGRACRTRVERACGTCVWDVRVGRACGNMVRSISRVPEGVVY